MDLLRLRTAPRPAPAALLPAVADLVAVERPEAPLHCLRPATITTDTAAFVAGFPGDVMYAVKCNPEPAVLRAVWDGGVRHFDCASAQEVALVRSLFPEAAIHFMHPVKSRPAIRAAWEAGVRDYALDHADELAKIRAETVAGEDLGLFVRLALPRGRAVYDLTGKFGAPLEDAAALLRAARPHAARLGLCFHVGSQCLDPLAWREAMRLAGAVIARAGVAVDVIDVGGGFPAAYPGMETPLPLGAFFAEIEASLDALDLPYLPRLWAEPGRALVAGGASVVVQVLLRRGDALYVTDGVYGSLSDAGAPGFRFPARLLRPDGPPAAAASCDYMLFGPTCDSADRMAGPFPLPADVAEGDWIEIGQLGAYGGCLRTGFNGFDAIRTVEVRDPPMLPARD
ncbi:Type III PLP-dependent enzyme [Rhodovastum atsumiense]|uniref:ornithine decarboxylase n=1 Tax=Rhodovastum atsumiense TaxID=504468 RepID=A0A5M6INF1_9PROT|nr:type III PLP-dependent enzyme [Rhodovastum atsumiense]KAA5609786.1 type III PLP-dependent enzyme [Rhodovastum atsumiense]CAH2599431.1 Type III PLP-dependent enzyme [Rhodovastum atsumiense]